MWSQNFYSGTRSAIFDTPKNAKAGSFWRFLGTENGISGAQIKILRPLSITNQPPKPPKTHLRNPNPPSKSVFWPKKKKTQKRVFSKSHNGPILKFCEVIPTTKVQIKSLSFGMVLFLTLLSVPCDPSPFLDISSIRHPNPKRQDRLGTGVSINFKN